MSKLTQISTANLKFETRPSDQPADEVHLRMLNQRAVGGFSLAAARASSGVFGRPSAANLVSTVRPTARHRTLRKLEEVSGAKLLQDLQENRWHLQATADALNVSKPNLYFLIETGPSVRTAKELGRSEIQIVLVEANGVQEAAALALEVLTLGLKRRVKALDLI